MDKFKRILNIIILITASPIAFSILYSIIFGENPSLNDIIKTCIAIDVLLFSIAIVIRFIISIFISPDISNPDTKYKVKSILIHNLCLIILVGFLYYASHSLLSLIGLFFLSSLNKNETNTNKE